jgi:hypothetical protein
MVSFDVVSLFTRVPITETMSLLSRYFEKDILRIFRHVLKASYFSFSGWFYEHIDGVAMGSPLFLVIAKFFMEDLDKMELDGAVHKTLFCLRYVDGTFVIWSQGPDRLKDFLDHLNSVHQNIQFTRETERNCHILLHYIDIYRRPNGSWS